MMSGSATLNIAMFMAENGIRQQTRATIRFSRVSIIRSPLLNEHYREDFS